MSCVTEGVHGQKSRNDEIRSFPGWIPHSDLFPCHYKTLVESSCRLLTRIPDNLNITTSPLAASIRHPYHGILIFCHSPSAQKCKGPMLESPLHCPFAITIIAAPLPRKSIKPLSQPSLAPFTSLPSPPPPRTKGFEGEDGEFCGRGMR